MPERQRERLNFGVATHAQTHHTAVGTLLVPFARAWERLHPAGVSKTRTEGSATNPIAVSQGAEAAPVSV
jgi:hypothetical protein